MVRKVKVGIIGTPNVGKSVIFNQLTGGKAWIGNWPGVTVEKKIGKLILNGYEIEIVDLPGVYSLTPYSIDQLIARNFIIFEKPDIIIDVVNASNLERSLYLTISLIEIGVKLIIVLNMIDIARNKGLEIDCEKLSKLLSTPVIPTIAIKGIGIQELRNEIVKVIERKHEYFKIVNYGNEIENAIDKIIQLLKTCEELSKNFNLRWLAIKILENDKQVIEIVKSKLSNNIFNEIEVLVNNLRLKFKDLETYIIECRWRKVFEICREIVRPIKKVSITISDILDHVLTHKILGIPIALSIIYLLFMFSFNISSPFSDLIDFAFSKLTDFIHYLANLGFINEVLESLLIDGLIPGVGAILVFLPVIALFFLAFSILEDSGYIVRVAFLMDKIFAKFKLPGKAIIPLIIGFGCNVPAIIATRTFEDDRDRRTIALITPLSTCSARLPVYIVIGLVLFGQYLGTVVITLYIISILLALIIGFLIKSFIYKGISIGFTMELPPYMIPYWKNILVKTWERTKKFLTKAGTVIFMGSVLVWLLSVTGPSGWIGPEVFENPELLEQSFIGYLGHFLEQVFKPMGWDWKLCTALFFGFIAKEIVISTLGILYGVGEEPLAISKAIANTLTPISAIAYMIFILTYVPCLATLATLRSEYGFKYAVLALVYEILLAYTLALLIVQTGQLLGIG